MKYILKAATGLLMVFSSFILAQEPNNQGENLYQTHCSACHGVNGGMDMSKRIAPPIIAVRMHYLKVYSDEMSFVNAITSWVEQPAQENSLMPGAIGRFGMMPKIEVSQADIENIAQYIYQGNVEKPQGFDKHYQEMHGKKGKGKHKRKHQEHQ